MATSILLVDDHPVVREGYRRLIERQPGLAVAAEAASAAEAYRQYKEHGPDLVILDLSLPGPSGIEAIRHIRQWDGAARILVPREPRPPSSQPGSARAAGSASSISAPKRTTAPWRPLARSNTCTWPRPMSVTV